MGLENLKQNIEREKKILKEILVTNSQLQNIYKMSPYEKRDVERDLLTKAIKSLQEQLKIINNSIPELLNSISPYKGLEQKEEKAENLVKINYTDEKEKISVTIEQKHKDLFLRELRLSKETLRRIKNEKEKKEDKREYMEFKTAGFYAKMANKFFQNFSNKMIDKDYFLKLNVNLRKSNMPYLLVTYLSMAFLSTAIGLIVGVLIFIALLAMFPVYGFQEFFLIPGIPALIFLSFYFYPIAEKRSIANKINHEIPFVTINMSAIAGS